MLSQILTHTPLYVWAILAFLVMRGLDATREREVTTRKLCIIPLVMLALSLNDIAGKFGANALPVAAWTCGAGIAALVAMRVGAARVVAPGAAGSVRLRGSWAPLALMMAVFCTKYAVAVAIAMAPHARHDAAFVAAVCGLYGFFNGCFLGRLALDLAAVRALGGRGGVAAIGA
jgi:hypothetical protein